MMFGAQVMFCSCVRVRGTSSWLKHLKIRVVKIPNIMVCIHKGDIFSYKWFSQELESRYYEIVPHTFLSISRPVLGL